MKRFVVSVLFLGACSTPPAAQSPQQIAAQVCPPLLAVLEDLADPLVIMPVGAKADIAIAAPIVAAVCSVNGKIDPTNLQSLAKTGWPALIHAVETSSHLTQQAQDNLEVAKIVVDAVLASQATSLDTPASVTK